MNDNTAILALTDIIQLPEAERLQAIKDKFSAKSHDELLNLLGNVLNVAVNYAQSCDETLYLHLVTTGDMHPYALDKLISPSFHGALNGLILAQKAPNQDVLCESCAYRCGTLANHCLTTQSDLAHALESDLVFYCHKDIENLECPTSEDKSRMKPCKGWAQHLKNKGRYEFNSNNQSKFYSAIFPSIEYRFNLGW